jgi:hypothetical protein
MRGFFFFFFALFPPPSYHRQRSNHRNSYILTPTVLVFDKTNAPLQLCAQASFARLRGLSGFASLSLDPPGRSISLLPRYTVRSLLLTKGFARLLNAQE